MRYVMIYPCDEDKNYIEVVIDEDRDSLMTNLYVYCIMRDQPIIQEEGDEMTPTRISLEVVEKQDENNKMKEIIKLVES